MELVPPPPPPKPNDIRKALTSKRRAEIAARITRGQTHGIIARDLRVTPGTVKSDVRWLSKLWRAEAAGSALRHKALLLQKNRLLQREAWEGYERSKQERKMIRQKSSRPGKADGPAPVEVTVEKEERDGGAMWLALLLQLQAKEAELLGVAPGMTIVNNDNRKLVDNSRIIVVQDAGLPTDMPWMKTLRRGTAEQGRPLLPEGQLFNESTAQPETVEAELLNRNGLPSEADSVNESGPTDAERQE